MSWSSSLSFQAGEMVVVKEERNQASVTIDYGCCPERRVTEQMVRPAEAAAVAAAAHWVRRGL